MSIYCRALAKGDKKEFLELIQQISDADAWNMNYYVEKEKTPGDYTPHILRHFKEKIDEYIKSNVIHIMVDKKDDGSERIIGYSKLPKHEDVIEVMESYLLPEVRSQQLNWKAWEYIKTLGDKFSTCSHVDKPGSQEFMKAAGFELYETSEAGVTKWRFAKPDTTKADAPKDQDTQA